MSERSQRNGVQLAIAAYLLWGALTVYWKQLKAFDAIEVIAWRMLCAGVVMAVIVTVRGSWATIGRAMGSWNGFGRLALAAALLSANWGSYVWAVGHDRVIETALGYFLAPLLTMLLGIVVYHEEPSTAQRFAFGAAAVAVLVLTVSYGRPPWVALVIAATWSVYGLVKRQSPLGAVDSLAGETFVSFVPAVVIAIVLAGGGDSIPTAAGTRDWLFVLGTGIVTAVPLMLFAGAAQSVPFTLLGPLNLIVPVINVAPRVGRLRRADAAGSAGGFRLRVGRTRGGDVGPVLPGPSGPAATRDRIPGLNDAAAGRTPCGTVERCGLFRS